MRGLRNKRTLITGRPGGIREASAQRFLDEGAQAAFLDNDRDTCRRIESRIPDLATIIVADVADPDAVAEAFKLLDRSLGGLDILINNAGISVQTHFLDISAAQWQKVIGVDLNGVFFVTQEASRRMMRDSGGGNY